MLRAIFEGILRSDGRFYWLLNLFLTIALCRSYIILLCIPPCSHLLHRTYDGSYMIIFVYTYPKWVLGHFWRGWLLVTDMGRLIAYRNLTTDKIHIIKYMFTMHIIIIICFCRSGIWRCILTGFENVRR